MNPPWLDIARKEVGVKETSGPISTKRVLEYHAITSLKATDDSVPWCSAFACWCVEQAGFKSPKSARAFDWLKWGIPLDKPQLGCIVVLKRGDRDGHVGFYEYETDVSIALLGGNQGDAVNVMKFSKDRIIGYRTLQEVLYVPPEPPWRPPLVWKPGSKT